MKTILIIIIIVIAGVLYFDINSASEKSIILISDIRLSKKSYDSIFHLKFDSMAKLIVPDSVEKYNEDTIKGVKDTSDVIIKSNRCINNIYDKNTDYVNNMPIVKFYYERYKTLLTGFRLGNDKEPSK